MKLCRFILGALTISLLCGVASAVGGTWQRTANHAPSAMGTPLLLTDGTVMVENPNTRNWYKLTPSSTGSYVNGTWSQLASTPQGYAPLYFGSAVLANGKVVVLGGEYNGSGSPVWTNQCASYDPIANTWANLAPPAGWGSVGDTQCSVLPNGKLIMANILDTRMAILDPSSLTWSALGGAGKTDRFDEEGWTLLPDGTILTCDAINAPATQRYLPTLDLWVSAGFTPQSLEDPGSEELGPMVLRPDGTVFATGATGHNAVYTPPANLTDPGTWTAAPDFPNIGGQLDIADGCACLLPNGNVLCIASPGIFNTPSHFFEFDGTNLTQVAGVPNASSDSSFVGNMVMLPTGQVLFTDQTSDVEIYTPSGGPQASWAPTITTCPTTVNQGASFVLQGTQLNGLSQCSAYGDDSTNATNYPLVRITNTATGQVTYGRTHDHSTMAVATGSAIVSTNVDIPASIPVGPSTLQVVTNGIPSNPLNVNVVPTYVVLPTSYTLIKGLPKSGDITGLFYGGDGNVLSAYAGPTTNITVPSVQVQVSSTSPNLTPTSFQLTLSAGAPTTGLTQTISLYNFQTNAYEVLDTRTTTLGFQTVTVTGAGDLSRYINPGTGEVRALIAYLQTSPVAFSRWWVNLDQLNWIIQ